MRGREAEQQIIRDLLRRAQRGLGGVVLVEGEPGIGKSLLLHEAIELATGQGFSLAAGASDQFGEAIPFFALRTALREPFTKLTADDPDRDLPDAPAWWISQIQAHLEQRAAAVPVLVCLDDLHWANPATLVALRTLPRELKRHPIAWILARSNTQQQDAENLFGILEKDEHPRHAKRALQIMSERTGGIAFFPNTLDEVDAISRTVAHDIRTQYAIGYKPTTPKSQGGYRQVKVSARSHSHGKLIVRTKSGYYAGPESASGAQ